MKKNNMVGKGWAKKLLLPLFVLILGVLVLPFGGGRYASNADLTLKSRAAASSPCTVHYYNVEASVQKDRTIDFVEEISFTMNTTPRQGCFYRALPKEGDRFLNITAEGVGNPDFFYEIKDNPDVDGFMDVNCYGGVVKGATLTYRFTYTMECHFSNTKDGMRIDFVGGGWPFALENVNVSISFPAELTSYSVYSSSFGTDRNDYADVVAQTDKTLRLHADRLPLTSSDFGQNAAPITVEFALVKGGLQPAAFSNWITDSVWIPLACGTVVLVLALLLWWKSSRKPILSTVVGFSAPNGMDPMELGYVLDGSVDNEDITSMIYYFASKGYLRIGQEGNELVLKKILHYLPNTESLHAKTIYEGLFRGDRVETRVSDLTEKFYTHADKARMQIGAKRPKMYEGGSKGRFFSCALLSFALFMLVPLLTGCIYVGGWYASVTSGILMLIPTVGCSFVFYILENYRYKWKKGKKTAMNALAIVLMAIGAIIYLVCYSSLLTAFEGILTLAFGYAILWMQKSLLVRTESYTETLGFILGFKEFILVTKKDRIEAMLETHPELFYDVLPYAQVMDVSNEWEEKFKSITIKPPAWYDGDYTLFDYWLINRSMRSMRYAMSSRPSNNGSSVGRSGGGGFSGGFSGGGGGGGGGGFR